MWPGGLVLLLLAAGLAGCGEGGPTFTPSPLSISTTSLPDGTVGVAYSATLVATGGTPPYRWSLASGTLPAGLTLDASSGQVSGTPTATGTSAFTVMVADTASQSATQAFQVAIGAPVPALERVSVDSAGTPANGDSGSAALSGEGRFVAFTSFANNLVPDDTNGQPDVFLRDRTCGVTLRVSVGFDADGNLTQGNSMSFAPALSSLVGDTVFVAYASDATNLVADDTNNTRDIFVTAVRLSGCNLAPVSTLRVSVATDGTESDSVSNVPTLSADGTLVAYHSLSGTLTEADANNSFDIFVTELDFSTGELRLVRTRRLSTTRAPVAVRLQVDVPDTPADIFSATTIGNSGLTLTASQLVGRQVTIVSGAAQGQSRPITANDATTLTVQPAWDPVPDATSVFRVLTDDQTADVFSASTIGNSTLAMTPGEHTGRLVEIVSGTGQGQSRSVTAQDATTFTVAPDWSTVPDNTSVFRVRILGDLTADFVGTNTIGNSSLTMRTDEHNTRRVIEIVAGTGAGQERSVTANGGSTFTVGADWATPPDNTSVFRLLREGEAGSLRGRLSADGAFVGFTSLAGFGTEDNNGRDDVYVRDLALPLLTLASTDSAGALSNGSSGVSALSSDGRLVLFQSSATNLVSGDTNSFSDLFLHDGSSGETTRLSVATDGTEGNGATDLVAGLSGGGRLAVFTTAGSTFVPDDRNQARDVYLRDRLTAETRRMSVGLGGTNPNGESFDAAISLDGSTVAFTSLGSNLVPDDSNGAADIFLLSTGVTDPMLAVVSHLPAPRAGVAYKGALVAVGGKQPLFWTLEEGSLPPGLFLDPGTGTISGVPQQPGQFQFTVLVMDADRPVRRATRTVMLTVVR